MPRFQQVDIEQIPYADINPKLHDLQSLAESESRYGFVEIPVINESTNKLVAGQGRIDALKALKAAGKPPPEGVTVIDSKWFIDVRFFPFKSDTEAQAYLFDSNNLGLLGGDFSPWDIQRLWTEDAYQASLKALAEQGALPVSVDGDTLDALLAPPTNPLEEWKGMPEFDNPARAVKSIIVHFETQSAIEQFAKLVEQEIGEKTKFVWFPKHEREDLKAYQYVSES